MSIHKTSVEPGKGCDLGGRIISQPLVHAWYSNLRNYMCIQ